MVARVVDHLLGAPDGDRRLGDDLLGALHRRGQAGLRRVEHIVNQPVVARLGGRQAAAGVGQFLDHRQRHQLGQALQRADVGHHADVDFLNDEERVVRGVAHAHGRDQIHRAAHAAALDGRDDGDAQRFQPGEGGLQPAQQVGDGGAAFGRGVVHADRAAKHVERHAGREMLAGAGDHQHARLAALIEAGQHLIQLAPEGRAHGVHRFGPAQHQVRDVVGDAELKAGEGGGVHGVTVVQRALETSSRARRV